jgi:hypothetical protein
MGKPTESPSFMLNRNPVDLACAYGDTSRKNVSKAQENKGKSEAQHFADVARKLFKVPKSEIAPKDEKA